jgi:acyltransferase
MQSNVQSAIARVSWIDICRGFAILFVMYAHMLPSDSYRYFFYAFHMPLFFFLSGVVFKDSFKSYWRLTSKSFKAIMIPYFLFAALTYLFWFIKEPSTHNTLQDLYTQIYGILYGNGNNGYLYFNVALWFLPCLFVTKLAFAAITRVSTKVKILVPVLVFFSVVGYIISTYYASVKLPLGIETALSAIVFFGSGYLVNKHRNIFQKIKKKSLLFFVAGLGLTIVFATINYHVYGNQIDMRMNRVNNYFLFYLGAISGIFTWVACSMLIGKNYILEYIGQHTLVLFVWHYLLYAYFTDIMTLIVSANVLSSIALIRPTLYTVLAVGVILIGTKLLKELKYSALQLKKKNSESYKKSVS